MGVWRGRLAEAAGRAWTTPAGLLALLVLGLGLRLVGITFQPLWWDEGYSVYFAALPLGEMVRQTAVDIHPPLYYALLHGWIGLWGPSVSALRWLSVLAGLAAVPLAFALGRAWWGARAGWLAGALLTLSPFHIYYSQEVRMYALVATLGLAATALYVRLWRAGKGGSRWAWVGYGAALAAALYTQYFAAFLLLAHALHTLWALRPPSTRRLAVRLLGAQGAAGLCFVPWLAYAGPKLWLYVGYKVGQDADRPLGLLAYLGRHLAAMGSGHWEGGLADGWWLGLLPVAFTAVLLAWPRRRHRPAGLPLLGLLLAVPLLGGFLVNQAAPFAPQRGERLLLLAAPAFLLLLAGALVQAWRRWRPLFWAGSAALLAIWAAALGAFYTVERYPNDDPRPLVARVAAVSTRDDVVVCVFPWQVGYFQAYHPEPRPQLLQTPSQVLPQAVQFWEEDAARRQRDLADLLATHPRVWLPAYLASGSPLEGWMREDLEELGHWALAEWYGSSSLMLFVGPAAATANVPAPAQFEDRLRLEEGSLGLGPTETGRGVLRAELTLRPLAPLADGTRLVLRLRDDAGDIPAQWDWEPSHGLQPFPSWAVGATRRVRLGLLTPAGLAPGLYRLEAGVADGLTGQELSARDGVGQVQGTGWPLGQVSLSEPDPPLSPAALPVASPQRSDLAPPGSGAAVRLLGHSMPAQAVETGWELPVSLFWQALSGGGQEAVVFVQGLDGQGQVRFAQEVQPAQGRYPTSRWREGTLVHDLHRLTLPADLEAGRYRLIAGLLDPATRSRWEVESGAGRGNDVVPLGEVEVTTRLHIWAEPTASSAASATFGERLRLVGYDLDGGTLRPGGQVRLTLHWQALATPAESYAVFVHLTAADGSLAAQDDHLPGDGLLPTPGWLPGEYVADEHRLTVPPWAGPGAYRLWVGWYRPSDGQRLPVTSDRLVVGDALWLQDLVVEAP
ncbi:MAG: hypothetical protein GX605_04175 [Chloroflexi bacterium]|nr:hypothetical protein [Chloroflexota bacterium]